MTESPSASSTSPLPTPTVAAPRDGARRRLGALAAAGALSLTALVGGTTGAVLVSDLGHRDTTAAVASPASGAARATTVSDTGTAAYPSLASVVAAVSPSVVSITVTSGGSTSEGSGVVLTTAGDILTNNHVVESAARGGTIRVQFSDGTSAPATLVGRDADKDLAVISAQGVSGLTPATFAEADETQVGDDVLAIGNPLGLEGSVTSGVVSALHRQVADGDTGNSALDDAIQTDAAINPGNSGGALVDTEGKVVGITTAIAALSEDSGNIGIGFAIPAETALTVAEQLMGGTPSTSHI
ncbi:S1C family serine protease [Motilibacter aurantiacus]|uniref:S1C family serine protease n=1 Tax=Motilibacter aurantiacus TaxID=2714955 RepID=UPI0014082971|nr:trypsin-like peptidase domain-containing protein [Motilibacter aurantiacus]NHC46475.1 trypsin-like serine protease [Motilibacter aurantiacus]